APKDGSTRGRVGRLTLPHGVVETPEFMPVGTNAAVKALDPDDLVATGARIILANTYHLSLRPGHERIAALGGLHRFMAWNRPILTDSGGFQVVSLGDLRVVDDNGVTFRSHLDGSVQRFTPEHAIAVQEALGSDVAVAILADDPRPRYLMGLGSPADLLEAVQRGVDLFDSVLPARVARNGHLWVPGGRLNMRNARFLDDPEPVQADCRCLLCNRFS